LPTGSLILLGQGEFTNTPINHSVIFVKQMNAYFTNDHWTAVVHISLSPYVEAVEILQHELKEFQNYPHFTAHFTELTRVQAAVSAVDTKLKALSALLPKADRRRALIGVGGNVFKFVLGTALESDVTDLQTRLETVQNKQGEVNHSLNNQISVFKTLDTLVKVDHSLIANWTYVLKDFANKTQEKYLTQYHKCNSHWICKM
jgi:prefoldin subunit 5